MQTGLVAAVLWFAPSSPRAHLAPTVPPAPPCEAPTLQAGAQPVAEHMLGHDLTLHPSPLDLTSQKQISNAHRPEQFSGHAPSRSWPLRTPGKLAHPLRRAHTLHRAVPQAPRAIASRAREAGVAKCVYCSFRIQTFCQLPEGY